MKAERPRPAILKSELSPAFQAARDAGYEQVSIVIELIDGRRFEITAGQSGYSEKGSTTPLEKWQSGNV
jgi:hypothetical protein